jgi:LacI family transcriptional regulator
MATTSLRNVAESSGVSIATVSRVLNGRDSKSNIQVSEVTRRKVLTVAKELNYHPNIMARGLKGGETQTVGILFSLRGPHNPGELVQMIAGEIHARHYITHIADTFCKMDVVRDRLRDYIRRGVDAVVIQIIPGMSIDEGFESMFKAFRAVVLIPSLPLDTSADQVVLCRQQAVYDAVDHLVDTGRRRPMILIPPTLREEKTNSILQRFKDRGLVFQKEPTIFHQWEAAPTDAAWEALETQFPDSVPFDALLCGSDEAAVAACSWLHGRGKKIPDDVAVVGFNDSLFAKFLLPPLASVNRQNEEMAGLVEKTLFDRLENPDMPPQRAELRMKFVLRASAG